MACLLPPSLPPSFLPHLKLQGLAFVDSQIPDRILLDMMIPAPGGPDGWYFLSQLRMKPAASSVPVVIITAIGIAGQVRAVSLGAKGLLRKPVDVETLLAEVKRYLKR